MTGVNNGTFDAVLIDSTDFNQAEPLFSAAFYQDCKALLSTPGILAFNLDSPQWGQVRVAAASEIMSRLFDVGAAVATPLDTASDSKVARAAFDPKFGSGSGGDGGSENENRVTHTAELEGWIDAHTEALPPLKNFVLPSGGICAAQLHVARAVCRRAERSVVPLVERHSLEASVSTYLNRLSDYLFTAARAAALRKGYREVVWAKSRD